MQDFPVLKRGQKLLATLLVLLLPLAGQPSLAQEGMSPRLQIGISILPAIVAANKHLANDASQTLPIYLVYLNNRQKAEQLRPGLAKVDAIRQRPLEILSISLEELLGTQPDKASAIFIAEPLGDELEQIIEFTQRQRLLLFSPFKGDVERGVAAGFRVTDKVLPMVNLASLKESNIHLKAFFLRIAVKHE